MDVSSRAKAPPEECSVDFRVPGGRGQHINSVRSPVAIHSLFPAATKRLSTEMVDFPGSGLCPDPFPATLPGPGGVLVLVLVLLRLYPILTDHVLIT